MRPGWALVLVCVVVGCGGAGHATAPQSHDRTQRAAPTYQVVAPVLERSGAPIACNATLTSEPPAGCSGVPVTGYDFGRVAGVVHFEGTGYETPSLRLTGRWNGHSLAVYSVAPAGPSGREPGAPARCRVGPTSLGLALVRRIAHDRTGQELMAFGPCGRTAWVLVAVADGATVRAVQERYGAHVIVTGWLRRLDRSHGAAASAGPPLAAPARG